ncbi:LysM peptidoglycan-binding domain-containing protein [Fulvimarina sp. 2208YS6-2-32]|uniref:LysM peptidoglycan-binding domain-containing protein n=1 Tax=Fulvimarina uroteuthidis TaxID=3098149 RepID=A0ABU5I7T2_9HYPH|nr:Gmad2 immunoglobulin-like domain-containing protein [Fulvimarina sp. 2208YS6-2-32]MDY8110988.1 LysM peptidoglycan-binding domain-containing protein [Fulvimarina sp. 2208YS6-2-32]
MKIELLQPKPFDLVSDTILLAGNAVAFEGTLSISVTEGHDEITSFTMVGGTSIQQFQGRIEIPTDAAFQLNRLFVTVSDDTAGGGESPPPMVTVPVFYGPGILPDYLGYREYDVRRGDTLAALAQRFYGDGGQFGVIQAANAHIIEDPNRIFPGQLLRIPVAG